MQERDFGSRLKEILNHSAIYGLGSVLQALLGFLLTPLYTKNFTPEMYGTWALVVLCGTLAGVVFYFGVSSALARSFYDYPDIADRKRVVSTALWLTIGGATLQVLLGILLSDNLSRALFGTEVYATHISIAVASSALGFINQLFFVVMRFERRSRAVATLNVLALCGGGGLIVYFLLGRKMGLMAPILGDALSQLTLCLVLAMLTREWLGGGFSRHEMKVQLAYGLPTALTGLVYFLHTAADRYLVKHFCALGDVGVYALGARIGMLIQVLLILPFGQIWTPMRMEMRDRPGTAAFFSRVLTYYVMIGLFFAFALALFAPEVVRVLGRGEGYAAAAGVVALVVCGQLIYGSVAILDAGIVYSRKSYFTTLMAFVALLVNWCCNIVLLPLIGFVGAGVSLVVSMSVFILGIRRISHRLFPLPLEMRRVGLAIAIFVVAISLSLPLQFGSLWIAIVMKTAAVTAIAVVFLRYLLLESEKAQLRGFLGDIQCALANRR